MASENDEPIFETPSPFARDTGGNLRFGLEAIREQTWSRSKREGLEDLCQRLDAGEPLKEAVEATRDRLPIGIAELLAANAGSPFFPAILAHYVHAGNNHRSAMWRIGLGLLYPLVLVILGVSLFLAMSFLILPQFEQMFEDFGIELPLVTRFVLGFGWALRQGWWLIVFGMVALAGLVLSLWMTSFWSPFAAKVVRFVPLAADGVVCAGMGQFCEVLAILLKGQVVLPAALRTAALSTGDPALQQEIEEIADDIEQGHSPAAMAGDSGAAVGDLRRLFGNYRNEQEFVDTLNTAASVFNARARTQGALMLALIEPLTLIVIGFLVSVVVLAVLTPNIKLLNALS